MSILLLNIWL
jgi:hypothetical protein